MGGDGDLFVSSWVCTPKYFSMEKLAKSYLLQDQWKGWQNKISNHS